MLATEFLHGQGLGNQLFAYVTTRVLARRLGYDFGIKGLQSAGDSRVNKKGFYFMNLDYGKEVPDNLERYDEYRHALKTDEWLRTDIRLTDKDLLSFPDNRIIYGNFQSEDYFYDEIDIVKEWLMGLSSRRITSRCNTLTTWNDSCRFIITILTTQ